MPPRRPLIQDLLVPKLLNHFCHENYDHAEQVARLSLLPYNAHQQKRARFELDMMQQFTALLRTATLFVVDHNEAQDVIHSAGESPLHDLPPLPYPRIAFECSEDVGWKVFATKARTWDEALQELEQRHLDGENPTYIIDVVLVNEIEQGRIWDVIYMTRIPDEEMPTGDTRKAQAARILAGGKIQHPAARATRVEDIQWQDIPKHGLGADLMRTIPIELAHMVNARGVSLVDVVSRADRRRAIRRGYTHPSVYWIDLRSGHEVTRGQSDREYHCRWMVRGHWRHLDEERKTWVRPYIKGPAGAPWKGRPVYMVGAA